MVAQKIESFHSKIRKHEEIGQFSIVNLVDIVTYRDN